MKAALLLALTLSSPAAMAQAITCSFTEPFFQMVVSEQKRTITFTSADEPAPVLYPILRIARHGNETRVVYLNGARKISVLVFKRDGKGSDGMSDYTYPYSAQISRGAMGAFHGGCYSASEPPRDPNEKK